MEGLKEALEYAVELNKPEIMEVNGRTFSNRQLHEVSKETVATGMRCSTLDAVCQYLNANIDELKYSMIIHVESPTTVKVYSQLNGDKKRENVISAEAILPEFPFGKFLDREDFNIQMQTKFVQEGTDYVSILAYVGTAEHGTIAQYSDDGVSQKAVVKTGLTQKEECLIPNPVTLKPYRTFVEVEQPESLFVFRMADARGDGIQAALFEADGKSWRNEAMKNIQTYLEEKLVELIAGKKLIVIA